MVNREQRRAQGERGQVPLLGVARTVNVQVVECPIEGCSQQLIARVDLNGPPQVLMAALATLLHMNYHMLTMLGKAGEVIRESIPEEKETENDH